MLYCCEWKIVFHARPFPKQLILTPYSRYRYRKVLLMSFYRNKTQHSFYIFVLSFMKYLKIQHFENCSKQNWSRNEIFHCSIDTKHRREESITFYEKMILTVSRICFKFYGFYLLSYTLICLKIKIMFEFFFFFFKKFMV